MNKSKQYMFVLCVITNCVLLGNSAAYAQSFDQEALIKKITDTAEERERFHTGLGFTITRTHFVYGEEQGTYVSQFDKLDKDVWRSSTEKDGASGVFVQNDDFAFDAGSKDGSFEFSKAKFGVKSRRDMNRTEGSHNNVVGMKLHEFLQQENMKLTPLRNLPSQNGRRVEGVSVLWSEAEGLETRGELHWLSDHGYVLTKVVLELTIPNKEMVKQLRNTTMEYDSFDDHLYLKRKISDNKKNKWITEISNVKLANSDKSFYTPESLGLDTPSRPKSSWYWWALASLVLVSIAVWFKFRKTA